LKNSVVINVIDSVGVVLVGLGFMVMVGMVWFSY